MQKRPPTPQYKDRILIVVVGLSPAVVTETIYALACESEPFIPTRVIVATTKRGRARIVSTLLRGAHGEGAMEALARDYSDLGLADVSLKASDVLVSRDGAGNELDDDAHEGESLERMGDLILATAVESVRAADSQVILSISGGRKSMSYLAGLAMTLVARPQDRLVHVLLNDSRMEFASPPYFYPPREPTSYLYSAPGSGTKLTLTAANCDFGVTLAEVPLLKLGALMPNELKRQKLDPQQSPRLSEMVRRVQSLLMLERVVLEFHRPDGQKPYVALNGKSIPLQPEWFAFLHCIADQGEAGFGATPTDADMAAFDRAMVRYARDEAAAQHYESPNEVRMRNLRFNAYADPNGPFYGLDEAWPGGKLVKSPKKVMAIARARSGKFSPFMRKIKARFEEVLGPKLAARALPPMARRGGRRRFPDDVTIIPAQPLDRSGSAATKKSLWQESL